MRTPCHLGMGQHGLHERARIGGVWPENAPTLFRPTGVQAD